MQEAGIPTTLRGYAALISAWQVPEHERGGALYLALAGLHEHYQSLRMTEQAMLDTRVRRTSRVLSSLQCTITEIEETMERVVLPMLVPEEPPIQLLQFYSKSRDRIDLGPSMPSNWRKLLSNFCPVQISIGTQRYHTPEHAFHAGKALCSSKPLMAVLFTVGGAVGPLAAMAKQAGSKAAYKQQGAILDQKRWYTEREAVQTRIIEARLKQDVVFRSILTYIGTQNIQLVHFDRSGVRSYWGATVNAQTGIVSGANRLGLLLTEAAWRLQSKMTDA
jgi:predicted NAD-dependent protein-ADP-ribosyltransferase YbiA (DUF1768 family)